MRIPWTSCVLGAVSSLAVLVGGCGDNLKPTTASLVVEAATPLAVTEAGGTATFTVTLSKRPRTEVTVALTSSDASEGMVSPATLELTPDNFDTPITVTVTGIDDPIVDGDQLFMIQLDGGMSAGSHEVMVTNADNDSAGITVMPTERTMTHETNVGIVAAFSVVLNTQPTASVTVPIASADTSEGLPDVEMLVFTPENWNAPQTVSITGVDDQLADGPVGYAIAIGASTSSDAAYNGIDVDDIALVNVDDDSPGVVVTPTTGLEVTEAAATTAFTVVLTSEPSGPVILDLSSSDPDEGTPAPTRLTFTPVDWNAPQVVTVTGVDDTFDDGDQSFTIVLAPMTSTDSGYAGLDPPDVAVKNIDDEAPGFSITPDTGLVTTEAGGTASFTIALISEPKADVIVPFTTSDATEGTPTPATLTFTVADWNIPQTITVTGLDDAVADGAQPYRIVVGPVSSTDPAYDGFDPPDVSVSNTDNDTAGITVAPQSGLLVSELGDSDFFDIVLNSEPTANVTINLSLNDNTEATVAPTSVTFTPANWNVPQRVTVTGKDDAVADGNQSFQVVTAPATSTDPRYNGINPANVSVTNFDDDASQVVVDSPSLLQVSENGTTATFTMVLTRMPAGNVTCPITSQVPTEGTVSPTSVTFTPANFDVPQTITVTGVDDTADDGDQLFFIQTIACSSTDTQYHGFNPRDVPARNADND